MLYDEFLKGTECRDTAYNYGIYKDLEILYMNSEISKEKIYEYGRKLVDNSLTAEQKEWNDSIDRDIADIKRAIEENKQELERLESDLEYWRDRACDSYVDNCKWCIRKTKREIKDFRGQIRRLKDSKYI